MFVIENPDKLENRSLNSLNSQNSVLNVIRFGNKLLT